MTANRTPARILVLVPHYRPGFKFGGPIASVEALAKGLATEFNWTLLTSDRDYGDARRYSAIPADGLVPHSDARIVYLKPGFRKALGIWRALTGDWELVYVNDLFSPLWGVWPLVLRRVGLRGRRPMLVAPRNQLSAGALSIKPVKKRLFLRCAKYLGLWSGILWHATSAEEEQEIRRTIGRAARVFSAPAIPRLAVNEFPPLSSLPTHPLRVVFFSRLSPKKNVEGAVRIIEGLRFDVGFDVVGPADSPDYLARVQGLLQRLPPHVSVRYLGAIEPVDVGGLLASYHALLFPTRGENFGHVVLEALASGCIPIISDRTPWHGLREKNCGWVVSLDDEEGFRRALVELHGMDPLQRERMRAAARAYARSHMKESRAVENSRQMFLEACGDGSVTQYDSPAL